MTVLAENAESTTYKQDAWGKNPYMMDCLQKWNLKEWAQMAPDMCELVCMIENNIPTFCCSFLSDQRYMNFP